MAIGERMERGEIWTTTGKDCAGKPRPAVIVQDSRFDATDSVTVCPLTTHETEAPIFRLRIDPNERNGLRAQSQLMVDKITTVSKAKIGRLIGRLDNEDLLSLDRAMVVFLGLAGSKKNTDTD